MGDPAGIGIDIVLAALARADAGLLPPFVLIADPAVVQQRARQLDLRAPESMLPVQCATQVTVGRPDAANAPATIAAIEMGAQLVREGRASALVTNPIAKSVLAAAGFSHPGHTEFLGDLSLRYWGEAARPVMMLAAPGLRVVPVTVHVPLASVPVLLTTELIVATARTTAAALTTDFGIARPRLAVCGLNPHAGESGTIGHEDETVIQPAVELLRAENLDVTGPHSADTLFHPAARERYDAVLAMYHDQALIPIKTIAFEDAVNVTLGLPFVRTSPDHGTAFGIAGTGAASPVSFIAALRLAAAMARRRAGQVA